jgi:hypothetical protein
MPKTAAEKNVAIIRGLPEPLDIEQQPDYLPFQNFIEYQTLEGFQQVYIDNARIDFSSAYIHNLRFTTET